ncbi:hypothetical protein [Streptomyces sp. NBC_00690]|uniref:hypothetical protein n=1 Tax=Streptomyces sp. NBC_00690 TaxID=2975808 RepID=UPI002E2AD7FB|nr:hypothetical protein [Streptomyces sp. NBC_00690]
MSRTRAHSAIITLVALVATAIGCAPGQEPQDDGKPAGPPSVGRIHRLLAVDSLVLPIERYLFTDRQVGRVLRARAVLTASCMRRYGHTWPVPASAAETGTLNPANTAHRYGLTDPVAAARYGYHPAPGSPLGRTRKKGPPAPVPPSEAVMVVATGADRDGSPMHKDRSGRAIPRGGCLGEATAALSGDPDKIGNRELVGAINIGSHQQSQRDSRVVAVFRAWSLCMQRHGHRYADPTEAPGASPQYKAKNPSRGEIALARTDVACKRETNVVGVWSAVDAAYQRRAIEQHRTELDRVVHDIDTQVTRADRVLRGR